MQIERARHGLRSEAASSRVLGKFLERSPCGVGAEAGGEFVGEFLLLEFSVQKQIKWKVLLAAMLASVPCDVLVAQIEPYYRKICPQGGGRLFPLSPMLRTHCL